MPERIAPMLAVAAALPPDGEDWAYEFKWDGVRAMVYVEGGRVRASSRNDKDLAVSFPELRSIGEFLGARAAVLDGEIVAVDDTGRPNFGRLQQRLHLSSTREITRRARDIPASYLAFDLVYLEGRSLLAEPYDERRRLLESLELAGDTFATPPSFHTRSGAEVLGAARDGGLEGVVAKRRASPYRPGSRGGDWVKIKHFATQEVVIGGWTDGKGGRAGSLGALLLGVPGPDGLSYVGKVGTGFDDASRRQLLEELAPLRSDESPFTTRLGVSVGAPIHFVRPELVGEVRYGEWTRDGHLRHPSWRGLRSDKGASEVVREP